jgi:uncharacterized protein YggU (UPF0235/DUF167 family)
LSGNSRAGTKQGGDAFTLWVRAKPRSRADRVLGWGREGLLEIQVKAVPERGEANRSCCRVLARLLDVPASRVSIEKGQGSVRKKFRVEGLAQGEGEKLLVRTLGPREPEE